MKKFAAALAALVIVGAGFTASPAFADEAPVPGPVVESIAPPVEVAPPHAREIPTTQGVDAGNRAAPDAATDAAKTSSFSGTVIDDDGVVSGVIVTAFQFDADGKQTFESPSVTTDDAGNYAIEGLAGGEYWLQYEEHRNPAMPSYQWWGASVGQPYGSAFTLPANTAQHLDFRLVVMAGVKGIVTCETCAGAPDPSDVTILVGVYNSSTDLYDFIDGSHPNADGSYGFNSLFPYDDYRIFAHYAGTGPFNTFSNSEQFAMTAGSYAAANVHITRHISAVSGISEPVNSNVSALYWDFLRRLPSATEVSFWGKRIQAGAELNIVSAGFVNSDEYRLIRIDAAYRSILGREPEASGRLSWLHGMQQGLLTTDDVETSFYASDEYYLQRGNTNTSFVDALYKTLLGRTGSSSEYSYWTKLVAQQGRAFVIAQFWDSAETIGQRVSGMYFLYLGRVPDAAGLKGWVNIALAIGDSGLRAGLSGSDEYFLHSQSRFRVE